MNVKVHWGATFKKTGDRLVEFDVTYFIQNPDTNPKIIMFIAHLYDEPLRDHDVDPNLIFFLNEHPALDPANLSILDMGCGTGKQLAVNRKHFPTASLVGLDLFQGMLQQAQRRCSNIGWVQGEGPRHPGQIHNLIGDDHRR